MTLIFSLSFIGANLPRTGVTVRKQFDIGSGSLPCRGDNLTDTVAESGSLCIVSKDIDYEKDECFLVLESITDDQHNETEVRAMAKLHGWV